MKTPVKTGVQLVKVRLIDASPPSKLERELERAIMEMAEQGYSVDIKNPVIEEIRGGVRYFALVIGRKR